MKDRTAKIIDILFKIFPIDKRRVLFFSCLNQYNDNPKYIAEKLHEIAPEYKLIWVTGKLETQVPPYFKVVRYESLAYLYQKNRSIATVDNGMGIVSGYTSALKQRLNLLRKKKGQLGVSTWHGTPLKCIGSDAKELSGYAPKDFYSTSDVFIVGSNYEKEIIKRITNNRIPIKVTGYARNDLLVTRDDALKRRLREKLGWPTEDKIILFAPTYRDNIDKAGPAQVREWDMGKLCERFDQKFGGKWRLAIRFHQIVLQNSSQLFQNLSASEILDGHCSSDMTEYLAACDALITDYSGSLFDVLCTHKPCFLYTPDYQEYCLTRGVYLALEELPMPVAYTAPELYQAVNDFDEMEYIQKCDAFCKELGFLCDGKAALRAVDIITDKGRKG